MCYEILLFGNSMMFFFLFKEVVLVIRVGCLGRERERSPAHSEGDMAEEALNAEKEALDSYFQGEDADIRVRAALRPVFWGFFGV